MAGKTSGAQLGSWQRACADVCVFNPFAPSNEQQSLSATYKTHEGKEEAALPWSRTWFVFPTCIYFLLVEGWLRRVLYSLKGSLLSCPRNGTNCTLRPLAGWGVPCVFSVAIFYSMHSRGKILQRSAWFPATNIRDSVQGPFQSLWLSLFFFCFSLYVFDIPRIVFCLMSARFSVIAFLACYNKKICHAKGKLNRSIRILRASKWAVTQPSPWVHLWTIGYLSGKLYLKHNYYKLLVLLSCYFFSPHLQLQFLLLHYMFVL